MKHMRLARPRMQASAPLGAIHRLQFLFLCHLSDATNGKQGMQTGQYWHIHSCACRSLAGSCPDHGSGFDPGSISSRRDAGLRGTRRCGSRLRAMPGDHRADRVRGRKLTAFGDAERELDKR